MDPALDPAMPDGRRVNTRAAAETARELLTKSSQNLNEVWRHCILQLFDDYSSSLRSSEPAHGLLLPEPPPTGDSRVDAALAALTEHLARCDGWSPPAWVRDLNRYAQPSWFVAGLRSLEATAIQESPLSFRKRGIFITAGALSRR